jgi:hypothetical protein
MTAAVTFLFYSPENRRYMPYHDPCSAQNDCRNAERHELSSHDISVLLQYLYLLIIFLLFFIILKDNRFARNLFKRSRRLQKVLPHLPGPGATRWPDASPARWPLGVFRRVSSYLSTSVLVLIPELQADLSRDWPGNFRPKSTPLKVVPL